MLSGSEVVAVDENLNANQIARMANAQVVGMYAVHYIINRQWDNLHPLPKVKEGSPEKFLALWGKYWLSVLRLCIVCRDLLPFEDLQRYPRASSWLKAILQEAQDIGYSSVLGQEQSSLRRMVADNRAYAEAVGASHGTNPHNADAEPAMWQLIDISLRLADRNGDFLKTEWNSYVKSITALTTFLDKNPDARAWAKGEKPSTVGRGGKREFVKNKQRKGFQGKG
jgi:hypothetical protein